jgi:putative ABC transport system permease protein
MRGHRLLNASERWFRLLLRLYPPDFRDEMGSALVETYRDRSREALEKGGVSRLATVWFAAFRDSVRNGLGERISPAVAWRRAGDWGRDFEKVSRRFWQKPLFVASVLATLTVGLGTFAVVYTAVDKILIEPLPYPNPENLYMIWGKERDQEHLMNTGPEIAGLQKAGGMIEAAAALSYTNAILVADSNSEPMRIPAMLVSANLFDLLGVHPALGRGFRPEEEGEGRPKVIVLNDGLWKRLGGDPGIIGAELNLSGNRYTVVGVMPPSFRFAGVRAAPSSIPDFYLPFNVNLAAEPPGNSNYHAVIRARRGAPPEEVHRAVDAVGRFVDERELKWGRRIFPIGLHTEMVEEVRPALLALGFAGLFLVLVLTVNLASLLLAKAADREREFAVARAVGANATAVVRAMLIEGGLLGLIGGSAGALAGVWGTRLLVALGPLDLPRRETIMLDWEIAIAIIILGAVLGLTAAILPALWATRLSLPSLVSTSSVRGSAGSNRMRRGLIVVQVALSVVLLSTGGLVVRSFERLLTTDPGFNSEGVLTFNLGLSEFDEPKDAFPFLDRVDATVRALPGVIAVSATNRLPLAGQENVPVIRIPGAPGNTGDPQHDSRTVARIFVRAGYVKAMGMRLLDGRDLEATRRNGVREALVDRHIAQEFFPNGSALGATVQVGDTDSVTIVGVVDQARLSNLHSDDKNRHLMVRADDYSRRPSFYVVRTERDTSALMPEIRAAIRQIDSRIAISEVRTMTDIVAEDRSEQRISAILIAGLALGALLLVAMGLFGITSGSIARRRGELAVRLALGATHDHVIRVVVGEGLRLVALGLILGIPGIYISGQAVRGLLIDVSPFDTLTLAAVAILLIAVALLACYLAARRVTTIEPERLLREG